ncbi:MAG: ATP-binding protein [Chloroflexota bacterium]
MPHRLPADREDELNLFDRLLSGQAEDRILLIKAPGGRGKSTLLRAFVRCCAGRPHIPLDLKGQTVSLHEIFYEMCDTLGWGQFESFARAAGNLAPQVKIERNILVGRPTIQVIQGALAAETPEQRAERRAALTQAFFDDLRRLPRPPVLIFDTFEAASPELADWFGQSFLPHAYRSPGLVVVIAGRQVPPETIAWSGYRHDLPPIADPRPWLSYCEREGLAMHEEGVKVLCTLFKGHPDEIVTALLVVAGQGGGL